MADIARFAIGEKVTVQSGDRLVLGRAHHSAIHTWIVHVVPNGGANVAVQGRGRGGPAWLTLAYTPLTAAPLTESASPITTASLISIPAGCEVALNVTNGGSADFYIDGLAG